MGKVIGLLLLGAGIVLGVVCSGGQVAAEPVSWMNGTPTVVDEKPIRGEDWQVCPTFFSVTKVDGLPEPQQVCRMSGEQMTVGTYFENGGTPKAAVSFALDGTMRPLRGVCEYLWGCLYAGSTDTFVKVHAETTTRVVSLYKQASRSVRTYFDSVEGRVVSTFERTMADLVISDQSGRKLSVGGMALSGNGQWLVVELRGLGLLRVNLTDLSVRRLTAGGPPYGIGMDPILHLAISNDGRHVVQAGENAGFTMIEVVEGCGEPLGEEVGQTFAAGAQPCPSSSASVWELFPGFRIALHPRFSHSGDRLKFWVGAWGQTARQVVLRAPGSDVVPAYDYVALGDSFTSGEGETDGAYLPQPEERERCHVSPRSYPYLVGHLPGVVMVNRGCAGAKIADVTSGEGAQFDPLDIARVMSVGIGGNDAGFMTKLRACVQPGTCEWVEGPGRWQTAQEIGRLYDKLIHLYRHLAVNAEGTALYAVGYPLIIRTDAPCRGLTGMLLDAAERQFMVEGLAYMNSVIQAAAQAAGIRYVDMSVAFAGRELCRGTALPAMNGLRIGDDISPVSEWPQLKIIGSETFHPTPYGHQLLAATIGRQYPEFLYASPCGCATASPMPQPPTYWTDEGREDPYQQHALAFLDASRTIPSGEIGVTFHNHTFAPHSVVRIEMHSENYLLGEMIADEQGGLTAQFTLPDAGEGYHTIHAYGMSPGLIAVDLYQEILVERPDSAALASGDTRRSEVGPTGGVISSTSLPASLGSQSTVANENSSFSANPPVADYPWTAWLPVVFGAGIAGIILLWYFLARRQSG
jgi:lysophospholipase L1-like esterase